jgi:hypothetical protein
MTFKGDVQIWLYIFHADFFILFGILILQKTPRSLLTTDSLLWWRVGSILWGIKLFSSLSEAPKVGFFVFIEKIRFLSIWFDYYCLFCFFSSIELMGCFLICVRDCIDACSLNWWWVVFCSLNYRFPGNNLFVSLE